MIVLIPTSCWKTASPIATSSAGRTHGGAERAQAAASSSASTSRMSSISSSGRLVADRLEHLARLVLLAVVHEEARRLGHEQSCRRAGRATGPRRGPASARQAPEEASTALTRKATRMPPTIISWFSDEIAPRISVGAISER